jgi:2-hydroxy-3-keto-5-methylthiopentenyl-1-phosphate phosphatase
LYLFLCYNFSEVIDIKTLVQCDFDGTITVEDVSFQILDKFADGDWRLLLEQYRAGNITVGHFNTKAFSTVKANRRSLIHFVRNFKGIRPGFSELVSFCNQRNIEFFIVSNGLDFYINFILESLGLNQVKVIAAKTEFDPNGMKVSYIGPNGDVLQDKFKEAYTRIYTEKGYRVIYIGNGFSDFPSAQLSYRVFARDELIDCCNKANLMHIPFDDLNDVITGLQDIKS